MNLRWMMPGALLLGSLGGCFAPTDSGAGADDVGYMPDDLPAGKCRDTEAVANTDGDTDGECPDTDPGDLSTGAGDSTGTSESGDSADACAVSDDCMGGVCVAPFDPESEVRAPFDCVFACLENLDEGSWCADDASCCDTTATCTERGYCLVVPE